MNINLNEEARECAREIGRALGAGTEGNGLEEYVEKLVDMSPLSFMDYIFKRERWLKVVNVRHNAVLRFYRALTLREAEFAKNDLG